MSEVEARTVLWYLVFVGFAVNYMIRINLNITIVEMVISKPSERDVLSVNGNTVTNLLPHLELDTDNKSLIESTDLNLGLRAQTSVGSQDLNKSIYTRNHVQSDAAANYFEKFSLEKWLLQTLNIRYEGTGFRWNEYQQGLILGAFFWAHWVTQIPGGILAKKYGTKLVFGLSNATGCWMCFLIPIFSYWDYRALIWWRMLQGLVCGLSWPAMHVLTAQWIPPNERSKFVTAYLGGSVGIAIFYPLFGYIISWTSWEWVFYICGVLGTMWWLGWQLFVYDTPEKHPRISVKEVRFIKKSLGASINPDQSPTPWKEILTSRSVWMNVIAQWGGIWGLFTLMTQAPTYFKVIHHWNIRATGILSGFPHLMRMIFAYLFSIFGDFLLETEKMSRTNVRKLATAFCCIIKGFLVLALAFYGYNAIAAIVLLTLATMVHGAVSSGPLASIVDISPNHAGIVLGISGLVGVLPGFISPIIVGILTLENQTFESWKYVFFISSVMLIGAGLLYVMFASSNLQPWNSPSPKKLEKELQLLSKEKHEDFEIQDRHNR